MNSYEWSDEFNNLVNLQGIGTHVCVCVVVSVLFVCMVMCMCVCLFMVHVFMHVCGSACIYHGYSVK